MDFEKNKLKNNHLYELSDDEKKVFLKLAENEKTPMYVYFEKKY